MQTCRWMTVGGHQQHGDGGRRARKKMLLLQVVLFLVVVVGWSYYTSLVRVMCHALSSLPNSEKIKLPTTLLLLRSGPPSPLLSIQMNFTQIWCKILMIKWFISIHQKGLTRSIKEDVCSNLLGLHKILTYQKTVLTT